MSNPASQPVTTSPKTPGHMRAVIDRLRRRTDSVDSSIFLIGTASATLAVGEVVNAPTSGTLDLADASDQTKSSAVGIVVAAAASGAPARVQTSGVVEVTTWALTTNSIYYLSATTPGLITSTAPTTVTELVVVIGIAVSATKLRLLPTPPILL